MYNVECNTIYFFLCGEAERGHSPQPETEGMQGNEGPKGSLQGKRVVVTPSESAAAYKQCKDLQELSSVFQTLTTTSKHMMLQQNLPIQTYGVPEVNNNPCLKIFLN